MTTPPPHPRIPARRVDPGTVAWPVGLLVLLVALAAWRVGDDPAPPTAEEPNAVQVGARSFGDARLDVPTSWRTLARADDRITWGSADRAHTVTLASTEASSEPLPVIAREVVRQSGDVLPSGSAASEPVLLDLAGRAPRGDAAVLVRFTVRDGTDAPVEVVQVWRRDARAGVDLVATWTSADGTWPASPREQLPEGGANG